MIEKQSCKRRDELRLCGSAGSLRDHSCTVGGGGVARIGAPQDVVAGQEGNNCTQLPRMVMLID